MSTYANQKLKFIFKLITVLTVLVQGTLGQSFLLSLGQNQRNFFAEGNSREAFLNTPLSAHLNYTDTVSNRHLETHDEFDDNNTTIIVIKSTLREQSHELSQTAMDIITIVWYVATFLALAAFFLLMACSERRCTQNRRNVLDNETPIAPPTPSPSYSEFAPPSYETVIKMQHDAKTSVFVIPFAPLDVPGSKDVSNNSNGSSLHTPQTPTTPAINFYTVNELEKFGC
ncbi:uncharacterized protein LOC128868228 [Anastrepha ludens]|uniref:uncharacterized protein LOC128868228 n=1 Tax=Anastrepha ludens TaxID=28586 RepID=UPI0023B0CEF7|nr:uncharacterized protein LOC128868228 [Anastrepha ludens]XP_053966044.1 uncharacterized protein LOC128868228 [Anastrepha ludens]XP_053966045.1 uncharacterized protein LOC128868228 [Anastrepha ludens]XP_053966046.1 uncharacterized protein LOC128868228 [Anastrepha ludens]XP_053966047.1 uncharacterized protein LOC128868228 [Anastrepha ludens]XP_053966048.1 uncharacterized protein LOC128868228 [Anastrepha ludens]XP_053966051.1 uncharacterized protein LOC128868228 [Anastrepha ludens]XP_05396605